MENSSIFSDPRWNRVDLKRRYRRLVIHTSDNAKHLPPEYIPSLESKFGTNVNLKRAHLYGEFCPLVGKAACPDFDLKRNVQEFKPDPYSPLLFSWDFNVEPLSWVALQIRWVEWGFVRRRQIGVVAESTGNSSIVVDGTVEFMLKFKDPKYRKTLIQIDGDSQGHRRNPLAAGTPFRVCKDTLKEQFEKIEIVANDSNPLEEDSIEAVNFACSNSLLVIDPSCHKTINSFQASQLIPGKRKLLKEAGEDVTHWFDAVKYPIFRLLQAWKLSREQRPSVIY